MAAKLVLLDLEETLALIQVDDSRVVEFLKEELLKLGTLSGELQRMTSIEKMLGQIRERLDKAAWQDVEHTFSSRLAEAEKSSIATAKLRKNAREAFSSMQSKGMKVGVITSLTEQGAKAALKELNLAGTFEVYGSPYHSPDQKEKLLSAVMEAELKPEDALYVVCSLRGIEAAKALGVGTIAVYSQERPVRQILASKPDALIYSISELEQTLLYFAEKARSSELKPPIEP